MSMKFFRAFCKPIQITTAGNWAYFKMTQGIADSNPLQFIEEVSVASGPIDSALSFDGFPNIFVKRARFFLPNVSGTFRMQTAAITTDAIEINQFASVRPIAGAFPPNPLRIRSDAGHPFRTNEWIDCNSFLKADPLNVAPNPNTLIALNATEIDVQFDEIATNKSLVGARLEIEFHCNMETHR